MTFPRFALAVAILTLALSPIAAQSPEADLQRAIQRELATGDLDASINEYLAIAARAESTNRAVAAQAHLRAANARAKKGDSQARASYERIVVDYPDQPTVIAQARAAMSRGDRPLGEVTGRIGDRPVWTGPKVDGYGRISPNGQLISYVDWVAYRNLSLHDLTANSDRALTSNKSWDDPAWGQATLSAFSPDGKQLAYGWSTQKRREVRITPVTPSGPQTSRSLLSFNPEDVTNIGVRDWSAKNRLAITITRVDSTTQIILASVVDGTMQVLRSTGWNGASQMFFSPDGQFLAFDLPATDKAPQRDVFVLAVDGDREIRAVPDASDDRVVGWSPDGKHLLFSSDRTNSWSLWAQPFAEGKNQGGAILLKSDSGRGIPLGVAKDTLYLYKEISSHDVKVARIDLSAGRLIGGPTHFRQGLLPSPQIPHWSPDGNYLVYPADGNKIAIRTVETGEVRRLTQLQYALDPRWSPDGHSLIAGGHDDKGRNGIFRIDVSSGDATLVVSTPDDLSFPRWSSDSTKIFYKDRGSRRVVKERDLRTAVERDVYALPPGSGNYQFEVSPDGRFLAVQTHINPSSQMSTLVLVPVAGGQPRDIVRLPATETIERNTLAWTPDSRALLTARKSGPTHELWLVDVQTSRARKMGIDVSEWMDFVIPAGAGSFSLSPDGRSIAFLMGKSSAEVWAMENILPPQASKR